MSSDPEEIPRLVWLDLENFGLDPESDPPIELEIIVTDLNLNRMWSKHWLIWTETHQDRLDGMRNRPEDKYVYDMHTDNGLFVQAMMDGRSLEEVESEAVAFLKDHHVENQPMCGNSVRHDRAVLDEWLEDLNNAFHYRIIDVSTIKELCRRYNPPVFEAMHDYAQKDDKTHRTPVCLDGTLREMKFYSEEFLLW